MLKPSYLVFNKSGFNVWVKKAGIHNPISENNSILEVTSITFLLNFCVLCFKPPASGYNKITRPAVVFARNGEARLVVKRQSYEDLIKEEV